MVALMLLSTALKDIAVNNNIYVESGTQLSGEYDNWEGVRNQTLIRGSKAIVDKCDVGAITSAAQDRDLTAMHELLRRIGSPNPTHVMDIYKLRRGRYKNVRIWGIMDLGTGRWQDLFVTDGQYHLINLVTPKILWNDPNMVDFEAEQQTKEIKEESSAKVDDIKNIQQQSNGWEFGI